MTKLTKADQQPTPESLLADGWQVMPDDGFLGHIGPMLWRETEDGTRLYGIPADDRHRNRSGVVQGGMLATLADRSLGYAARKHDPGQNQATLQLNIQYIAPARIGDFIIATCKVVQRTSTVAFVEGTLTADDRIVAKVSGIWKIKKGRHAQA